MPDDARRSRSCTGDAEAKSTPSFATQSASARLTSTCSSWLRFHELSIRGRRICGRPARCVSRSLDTPVRSPARVYSDDAPLDALLGSDDRGRHTSRKFPITQPCRGSVNRGTGSTACDSPSGRSLTGFQLIGLVASRRRGLGMVSLSAADVLHPVDVPAEQVRFMLSVHYFEIGSPERRFVIWL